MNIKKTSQKGQNDTEVVTKTTLIPMTLSNKNKKKHFGEDNATIAASYLLSCMPL